MTSVSGNKTSWTPNHKTATNYEWTASVFYSGVSEAFSCFQSPFVTTDSIDVHDQSF